MRMLAVVVLLLVAVAVVCFPKVGAETTPDAEVTLCAPCVQACECAEASHVSCDFMSEVALAETNDYDMETTLATTRNARALTGLYEAGDRRGDLFRHETMKGARSVGVRAGRA